MLICSKCRQEDVDETKFCSLCGGTMIKGGEPIGPPPAQASEKDPAPPPEQTPAQGNAPPLSDTPPPPEAPAYDPVKDATDNKVMGIIAYLLFFVPLLMGAHKASQFVKYHTNQGTALFIFYVLWGIVTGILGAIIPIRAVDLILNLSWFVPAALLIIGILNALKGRCKPLPLIGKFNIIK